MAVDGASPRLDALQAPLTSARVLERGSAQRKIDDAFARMNGVRLRLNPNPRLFVRVVDEVRAIVAPHVAADPTPEPAP